MPKPSDYTPARRYVMQAVMCAILGGTVALAAVVSRSARSANRIQLAQQPTTEGEVSVRLPARWKARPRGEDPRAVAIATESAGEMGRTIEVLTDKLDAPVSPVQYLVEDQGVPIKNPPDEEAADEQKDLAISVAGEQGVLIGGVGPVPGPRGVMMEGKHLYACAITPSLRAVLVHLSGPGEPDPGDTELIKQVAQSIVLSNPRGGGATAAETQRAIRLPGNVACTAPSGFAPVEQNDPNRTDVLLWPLLGPQGTAEQLERTWGTIELISCLCPEFDPKDPKFAAAATTSMLTLLCARDSTWRVATIQPDGPGQWRAELPAPQNGQVTFPARAYLKTGPGGRALLAIFRGGFEGGGFDEAWKQLASSARFDASAREAAQLADAGAEEAGRLRFGGYEHMLSDRDEQWWLLTDASARPHLGWSHVDFQLNVLSATGESRLRRAGGRVVRLREEWSWKDDAAGGQYRADVARSTAGADGSEDAASTIQQTTTLRKDQLTIGARARGTAAPAQWKSTLPPQYVPGQLLPLLMPKLSNKPMLLRAESFVTAEVPGAPEPLTIIIRPAPNNARKAEGDTEPLRCLTAEVNGSGRLSRWYLTRGGEVECVELPGGVQRVPSDGNTIGFDFSREPGMAP